MDSLLRTHAAQVVGVAGSTSERLTVPKHAREAAWPEGALRRRASRRACNDSCRTGRCGWHQAVEAPRRNAALRVTDASGSEAKPEAVREGLRLGLVGSPHAWPGRRTTYSRGLVAQARAQDTHSLSRFPRHSGNALAVRVVGTSVVHEAGLRVHRTSVCGDHRGSVRAPNGRLEARCSAANRPGCREKLG